jgi:hypothetical protein
MRMITGRGIPVLSPAERQAAHFTNVLSFVS